MIQRRNCCRSDLTEDRTRSWSDLRGVSPVIGVAFLLVIVVLLVAVVGVGFLGLADSLRDPPPIGTFEFEEREGIELTISATAIQRGDEFYVLDDDGERIDGSTMTTAGDEATIPLICSPGMGDDLTVMGVNGDHTVVMGTRTVTEIGITVDSGWEHEFDTTSRVRGVDHHGDYVYAADYESSGSEIRKIPISDPDTEEWAYTGFESAVRPITFHEGYIYAGSGYGTPEIHRINATTGNENGTLDLTGVDSGSGTEIDHIRDIDVIDGELIVGTQDGTETDNDGTLFKIDDPNALGDIDVADITFETATASVKGVTVDDEHVYTAGGDGIVRQYDQNDLTATTWEFQHTEIESGDPVDWWGVTSIRATQIEHTGEWVLYSASDDGPVVKHNRSDGEPEWTYDELDNMKWGLQVDDDGNVYTGKAGDAEIHRISPTGCQVWAFDEPNYNVDEMAIDEDGNIYAGDDQGVLYRMAQPTDD